MDLFHILVVPIVCISLLIVFKTICLYMDAVRIEPYFSENKPRQDYLEALSRSASNDQLRTLLVKRATEGVRRFGVLREERGPITNLKNLGVISESVYKSFENAEKDTMNEILEIKYEAEALQEGWSRSILQETARKLQFNKLALLANG